MVGFFLLIRRGETIQLVLGFAFCLACLLFTNVMSPFKFDDDDFFSVLCNFVLTATVFLCVVLKQATLSEALDTYMSEEMRETYWFDSALVSGLLIAINALLFAYVYARCAVDLELVTWVSNKVYRCH